MRINLIVFLRFKSVDPPELEKKFPPEPSLAGLTGYCSTLKDIN